ncbi:MAG: tetratricopeptide repeat protein [Bacteroidota bacterium]|jgi:putative thioredoxin
MPYDVSDFQKEVLERSFDIPVLVDFWAEWCAPCRMLSPVLEQLARQNIEKWVLAKVNTERLPDVASKYAVQSIPDVKLFVEGKIAGEFVGAQPEHVITQWLRKHLPSKLQGRIDLARTLIAEEREPDARKLLENIFAAEPENQEVKVLLAQLCLFDDPKTAADFVRDVEDPKFSELADAIRTLSRLVEIAVPLGDFPESISRQKYAEAVADVRSRQFDAALEKFIDIIRTDRYYDDDGSRKACIALFKFLGEEHEITRKHRRDFGSALYM